jgi:cytochrome c oxidase cbb3-type subunit 4
MDINDLRGISTILMLVSFVGLVIWAYSKRRKKSFDEAANLPFADEDIDERTISEVHNHE